MLFLTLVFTTSSSVNFNFCLNLGLKFRLQPLHGDAELFIFLDFLVDDFKADGQ